MGEGDGVSSASHTWFGATLHDSQYPQIGICRPVTVVHQWQAHIAGAFDATQFAIDWAAQIVTSPQGQQSVHWYQTRTARGRTMIHVDFAPADCTACAVRTRCTRAKTAPWNLTLPPQAEYEAIQAARRASRPRSSNKPKPIRLG